MTTAITLTLPLLVAQYNLWVLYDKNVAYIFVTHFSDHLERSSCQFRTDAGLLSDSSPFQVYVYVVPNGHIENTWYVYGNEYCLLFKGPSPECQFK